MKMNQTEDPAIRSYFRINASLYVPGKDFPILRPASLNHPKDNAVMFIIADYLSHADCFYRCSSCLVFWPDSQPVPQELQERHAVVPSPNPKNAYCAFFRDNGITYDPPVEEFDIVGGAYIARTAKIGKNCRILPGAYVGGEVEMGDDCYIGSGARLMGEIHMGNRITIRENTVIGADGLSTDRDADGSALTMPQFGGVIIEDDVKIGALTVIARGAIDQTILRRGVKIDNSTFISHNVVLGEDTFVVGETIMFGSSSTGKQVFISGNSTIRDGRHIEDGARVGMGSVVTKNVDAHTVVKGNPAH